MSVSSKSATQASWWKRWSSGIANHISHFHALDIVDEAAILHTPTTNTAIADQIRSRFLHFPFYSRLFFSLTNKTSSDLSSVGGMSFGGLIVG